MRQKCKSRLRLVLIASLSLALSLFFLLAASNFIVFNESYYAHAFSKLPAGQMHADAMPFAHNIIEYFKGDASLRNFYGLEADHLRDVKEVVSNLRLFQLIISLIAIILAIALFYLSSSFLKDLFLASLYGLLILITLFIVVAFAYEFAFYAFHAAFFPQGNWMFDQDSLIIQVFPAGFFKELSWLIALHTLLASLLSTTMLYVIQRKANRPADIHA